MDGSKKKIVPWQRAKKEVEKTELNRIQSGQACKVNIFNFIPLSLHQPNLIVRFKLIGHVVN